MGRYSSYGIATVYALPINELCGSLNYRVKEESIADFCINSLRTLYPEDIYEISQTDTHLVISLKDNINGSDIYRLLKDFASITPNKNQLTPEIVEEIGDIIKDKPLKEVMELAEKKEYDGFQPLKLPEYLYWSPIPVDDRVVYTPTMVKGIMIGYSYNKIITEDDTEPFQFLTMLLRYRLKENPLSPALLAYLSV